MEIINLINKMPGFLKTLLAMGVDYTLALVCFYFSVALRLGDPIPYPNAIKTFLLNVFIVGCIQAFVLNMSGLYKGIWRYSSTYDLIRIIKGASLAVIISTISLFFINRLSHLPRSVIAIDWFLLIVALGGSRFSYRVWRDNISLKKDYKNCDRVFIIGAGAAGEKLIREIKKDISLNINVVGFIDDKKNLRGRLLHGAEVFGGIDDLNSLIKKYFVDKIYIAIPSSSGKQLRRIVDSCKNLGIEFKTLPKLKDLLNEQIDITQLRNVKPEDLLGRAQIHLDDEIIYRMIRGSSALVTGAGGSIGSELCHQILKFSPKYLYIYDFSEFLIYELYQSLESLKCKTKIVPIVGDVKNFAKLESIFIKYHPTLVFHAAAYKHVPLMEKAPYEAVQTNIVGTKNIVDLSVSHNVLRFVFVSTDKAVNPTNIMGSTKRIAEIIIQNKIKDTENISTLFMVTRFGNVLGSSGSVIPLFKKQIKSGGPITVTHPEVTRYFMTISEATQLVLQAGAMGNGGEVFHFDMGDSVKIINLAKEMAALYGLKTGEDIEIKFTGLRPGEKLYEELLNDKEEVLPTVHPLVKVAKARDVDINFDFKLDHLLELGPKAEQGKYKSALVSIVPEYCAEP